MTSFSVVLPSRNDPSGFSGIVLQQDEWNDFGFQTQYHLYVATPEFNGRVGAVKILRRGQTSKDPLMLLPGPMGPLGEEWVSLGQDLDYYERLADLPEALRQEILSHLRDALTYPEHAQTFFDEKGWDTSLLRHIAWESFQQDASVLLERDYSKVARLGLDLSFQMTGWADPLVLNFDTPTNYPPFPGQGQILPDRIAVVVGRNGSGKSTLLSRLARIIHASQRDRSGETLAALGKIKPEGIGFTRIINIAYSAFDAFQLPGVDYKERRQIVDDLERGSGRYHYCGLRNIAREVHGAEGVGDIDGLPIETVGLDRQELTILKTSEELANEFAGAVAKIVETQRMELFSEVCKILASEASFADLGSDPAASIKQYPLEWFKVWSTGHKIVMHAVVSLVAYTEPKSIVLFDEPESHLHPPLLAALMHAVRLVLRKNDAFAVVATHSPVVVQETLRRHTAIVRRSGRETGIFPPRIETYGESIGEITNEVFGLTADTTDYHETLSRLVSSGMSLDNIERLFENGLSLQARAYVMTELARRDN